MQLIIIEPCEHGEVLAAWCRLLDVPGMRLWIYPSRRVAARWSADWCWQHAQVHWECWPSYFGIWRPWPQSLGQALAAGAVVVLLTAVRPWRCWARLSAQAPLMVVVHKATTLLPQPSVVSGLWPRLRQLRNALAGDQYWQQQLLHHSIAWAFPNLAMLTYCRDQGWLWSEKKAVVTPFAYFFGSAKPASAALRIAIPGTVKANGRNYAPVLTALERLGAQLQVRLELEWLGVVRGRWARQVLRAFQALARHGIEVIYHRQPLNDAAFAAALSVADLLILPLAGQIRVDGRNLPNGFAGISGTIHDQLGHGLPAMLDAAYPPCARLAPLTWRYANAEELFVGLQTWISTGRFRDLRAAAPRHLAGCDQECTQQQLIAALQDAFGPYFQNPR